MLYCLQTRTNVRILNQKGGSTDLKKGKIGGIISPPLATGEEKIENDEKQSKGGDIVGELRQDGVVRLSAFEKRRGGLRNAYTEQGSAFL